MKIDSKYKVFDFGAWHADYLKRREARKVELIEAFHAGKKVLHHGRIWPDMAEAVFLPEYRSPELLGEHIENREAGFAMDTRILDDADDSAEVQVAFAATGEIVRQAKECAA